MQIFVSRESVLRPKQNILDSSDSIDESNVSIHNSDLSRVYMLGKRIRIDFIGPETLTQ